MRRLLYLALALTLLALTGLVYVRIASTPAYLARTRLGKLQPGISREEVQRVMAERKPSLLSDPERWMDCWHIADGYFIIAEYDLSASSHHWDHKPKYLIRAWVHKPSPKTLLDHALEVAGLPVAGDCDTLFLPE
jgi:hypothetical protein